MTARSDPTHLRKSGTATIDNHALYWERHGRAEAGSVVLLHHGLGSVRSWRRQIPPLCDAGWEVLAYDRWGYGRSDPRPEFNDRFLLQDTHEAIQLLDLLGIGTATLVGHSDGGTIALLMAGMQPRRVSKMIVVAAHIYYEEKMRTGLLEIASQTKLPPLATALQREHGPRAADLTENWIKHWSNSNPTELDLSNRLKKIICPTLVIQGELDEHATEQHARDIAEGVQHGYLWLAPAVGHMLPHEISDEFNNRMLDFLSDEHV